MTKPLMIVPVHFASERDLYQVIADLIASHWAVRDTSVPLAFGTDRLYRPIVDEEFDLERVIERANGVVNVTEHFSRGMEVSMDRIFKLAIEKLKSDEKENHNSPFSASRLRNWLSRYRETYPMSRSRSRGRTNHLNPVGASTFMPQLLIRSYQDRLHETTDTNISALTVRALGYIDTSYATKLAKLDHDQFGRYLDPTSSNGLDRDKLRALRLEGTVACPASMKPSEGVREYFRRDQGVEMSKRSVIEQIYDLAAAAFDKGVRPWFENASPADRRKYLTEQSVILLEGGSL